MPAVPAVALLVHGAGSSPDCARRLLDGLARPPVEVRAVDARGHVEQVVRRIGVAYDDAGGDVAVVAGISLGAHAVAMWASGRPVCPDLVLAMPAWTGSPDGVAAMTAATARDIEVHGRTAVLERLRADPLTSHDWVLDELACAWSDYDDESLATALTQAARSPGPDVAALRRIAARTAVVALADDPLHPETVAAQWADAVPGSALEVVRRDAPREHRSALGLAGRRGLERVSGSR
jgi:pimeloyl-ACP methyl ester carboxylesterase